MYMYTYACRQVDEPFYVEKWLDITVKFVLKVRLEQVGRWISEWLNEELAADVQYKTIIAQTQGQTKEASDKKARSVPGGAKIASTPSFSALDMWYQETDVIYKLSPWRRPQPEPQYRWCKSSLKRAPQFCRGSSVLEKTTTKVIWSSQSHSRAEKDRTQIWGQSLKVLTHWEQIH